MKKKTHLSDEVINSFIDNEYPAHDRALLLAHLQVDEASKKKACQANNLKDMVTTAYQDIPPSKTETQANEDRSWMSIVASAVIAVIVGLVIYQGLPSGKTQRIVLLDPDGRGQLLSQNPDDEMRIVFHVSHSTRKSGGELLDDIEGLLQSAKETGKRVRVEVVAHAAGLDLLRERLSTQKERITLMSEQYPDLTFVACLNTIERMRVEKGVIVSLIPEAKTTMSGVAYVVKRQKEGWLYIQV